MVKGRSPFCINFEPGCRCCIGSLPLCGVPACWTPLFVSPSGEVYYDPIAFAIPEAPPMGTLTEEQPTSAATTPASSDRPSSPESSDRSPVNDPQPLSQGECPCGRPDNWQDMVGCSTDPHPGGQKWLHYHCAELDGPPTEG